MKTFWYLWTLLANDNFGVTFNWDDFGMTLQWLWIQHGTIVFPTGTIPQNNIETQIPDETIKPRNGFTTLKYAWIILLFKNYFLFMHESVWVSDSSTNHTLGHGEEEAWSVSNLPVQTN